MTQRRFLVTYGLGILLTAALVAIAIVEVVGAVQSATPSVSTLQHSIAGDVQDRLMVLALSGDGPPSADVACPRHASLNRGSVFSCTATISETYNDPSSPGGIRLDSWTRRLQVTMLAGGKARWQVVPAGQTLGPS